MVCGHLVTADRTPKQKLKLKVTAEPLLALFQRHKDSKGKQVRSACPTTRTGPSGLQPSTRASSRRQRSNADVWQEE